MIYFALSRRELKIGYSRSPEARLKSMRYERRDPHAHIVGLMAGGLKREAELHRMFAHIRLYGERELFRPCPELMEFIETNARRPPKPRKPRAPKTPMTFDEALRGWKPPRAVSSRRIP